MNDETPTPRNEEPDPRGQRLSAWQQELLEELMALDPELGGLYQEGLALVERLESPGVGHILAHVGRELTRGVVTALLETDDQLSPEDLEEISENENHRGKIAHCLGLRASDPQVSEWFELHKFFPSAAHHRGVGDAPDPGGLRLNFERLTRLLYGLVGPYFKTQSELDVFLEIEDPVAADVAAVREYLLRPQARRYFYGHLTNSAWLPLLAQNEVFDRPPERRVNDDGSWQAVVWPEGEFLRRVAAEAPDMVVDVLLRLSTEISNPAVWSVVADVAIQVPPELGARLAPNLAKAVGNVLPVVFADGLLKLIPKLAEAGQREAFVVADALLRVPSDSEVGELSPYSLRSDWVFPRLRFTQFPELTDKALGALEGLEPERLIQLLLNKINQISALSRKLDLRLVDLSRRSGGRPSPEDVVGQLLDAASRTLTRFSLRSVTEARRALELVGLYDGDAFAAMKYAIIGEAGEQLPDELDAVLESTIAVEPEQFGRAIASLLRNQFANASDGAQEVFWYSLQRGPDSETVTGTLAFRGISKPTASDIKEIKEGWQRRRLTWFRGEIPERLRELAQDLGVWGETPSIEDQELAEVGFYSGGASWGEPRSFAAQDLDEREAAEIVQLLLDWQPDDQSIESGTKRGLEMSLQELASASPNKALEAVEIGGASLEMSFVRSVFDGLRDYVRTGEAVLDWVRAGKLAQDVLGRENQSGVPLEVRRWTLRAIIDLFEEGARKDVIPPEAHEDVWAALIRVIGDPVIWNEGEEPVDTFYSVLSAGLNRTASRTVLASLTLGLSSYRQAEESGAEHPHAAAEPQIVSVLDLLLQQRGTDRVTAEVILGQFLPQLGLLAPKWLEAHRDELLASGASKPLQHPAWGGYVTRARYNDSTFKSLRPWYVKAAREAADAPPVAGPGANSASLTRGLVDHVLTAVVRGVAALGDGDGLVETTFANVPAADRAKVYWAIFRGWSDTEQAPSPEFIGRLLAFWEWRLEELEKLDGGDQVIEEAQGLAWFMKTPYLPLGQVLALGLRTAKVSQGRLESYTEWDRLSELAHTDTDVAYEIAELVLEAQLREPHHYVPVGQVKEFLRFALSNGQETTKARARRMVNRLGEKGYDAFGDLLS